MPPNSFSTGIRVFYQYYFHRGQHFTHRVGQFPHWALLAPEEGSFTYELDGKSGEISFGQLLLSPPRAVLHRHITAVLSYHIIAFQLETDQREAGAPDIPTGAVTIRDTVRLSSTLHHLRELCDRETPSIAATRIHLLRDLLYLAGKETTAGHRVAVAPDAVDHSMTMARWHIENRAFHNLNLREVAKDVHMTPVQLTRRFRASFGETPVSFATSLRLNRARGLLLESDLPVRQIATQCGFNSEQYFSRVFFEATQMRPGEFRKTRRF